MLSFVGIAIGGALGAMARYLVVGNVGRWFGTQFPWGTLCVNALGSLVIGVLFVLIVEKTHLSEDLRPVFMVGFLGAFTTFSTFSLETLMLLEESKFLLAMTYAASSVILCVFFTWLGVVLTRAI